MLSACPRSYWEISSLITARDKCGFVYRYEFHLISSQTRKSARHWPETAFSSTALPRKETAGPESLPVSPSPRAIGCTLQMGLSTSHTHYLASRGGRNRSSTRLPVWDVQAQPHCSLGRSHLRRLFPDLCRVDDELERVRILVLLHQLEIYKPFGVRYGGAVLEPVSGRFKQRSCEFILAVHGQAFHRLHQLSFRHAEVVD